MAYKKYIKRNGKTYGPYVYHSHKEGGKVITEYLGKHESKNNILFSILLTSIILISLLGYVLIENPDYFQTAKKAAFNSINSITGLVTEGEIQSEDVVSEETALDESSSEAVPEEIPQEDVSEIPVEGMREIPEEQIESEEILNETDNEISNQNITEEEIIEETNESSEIINESEAINEIEVVNETPNITNDSIMPPEAIASEINITVNASELNITNETGVNETIANITEINITEENLTIQTIQFQAVLNQKVKWKKEITSNETGNLTISLPEEAENVSVKKVKENSEEEIGYSSSITGGVILEINNSKLSFKNIFKNFIGRITGFAVAEEQIQKVEIEIDEIQASYEIEYETPAPTATEEIIENGKRVVVSGPETIHYQDVLAFTNLDEPLNVKNPEKIKIHWVENNTYLSPLSVEDLDSNGVYDYVSWIVPHLSNQTFEIIVITKAEHLDSNREFISDIYDEVKELDGIWSETIPANEYVRVVFEQNLTNKNDITIFPGIVSGNPNIEIYEKDENDLVAEFTNIVDNEYNKVFLTNLVGEQDIFDLRVVGGSVEFDYIVDPQAEPGGQTELRAQACAAENKGTPDSWGVACTGTYPAACPTDLLSCNDGSSEAAATYNANTWAGYRINTTNTSITNCQSINQVFICYEWWQNGGDPTTCLVSVDTNQGASWSNANTTCPGTTANPGLTCTNVTSSETWTCGVFFGSGASGSLAKLEITRISGGGPDTLTADALFFNVTYTSVDNPPQWFDNSTNSTKAGEAVEHRVRWMDGTALSGYIFEFDSGDGGFENDTFVSMTGTANWSNVTKVVNSTQGSTIKWRVYTNDSANQFNVTDIFSYVTTTDTPPQWSNPLVNNPTPNPTQTVIHNVTWTDDDALSSAKLEINSTGAGCDTTANVSSQTLSGNPENATLSWTVENACEGKTIGWRQWANDSADQWNVTSLQTYTVNNVAPIASFGTNPVDFFNSSTGDITFDLKVSDNLGVSYLVLYGNWSAGWAVKATNSSPINDTFWNRTFSGVNALPEGRHVWAAWGNDTLGNFDFTDSNRTLTVDKTKPNTTRNSPLNQSYATNSILFNVTATDALTGINTCTYSLNGAANVSLTRDGTTNFYNDTNSSMTQGSHTANFYCTDFAGNVNGTEQVTFFIDSINPLIQFVAPTEANASSKSRTWIFANVSITETNFQNVTFKLFNSTGLLNETTFTDSTRSINWTNLDNNAVQYWYNASTYDSAGNFNQTETRYITLTSDQAPTVAILYPQNTTYNVDVTQLNFSAEDDISLSHCWYSLNGGITNSTPEAASGGVCANFTGLASIQGSNNWSVYANDSTNQIGSDVVFFFKDTINPNIQFVANTETGGSFINTNNIDVNVTASDANLDAVTIRLYNSTPSQIRINTSATSPFNITYSGLSDGLYYFNATANDTATNSNSTETRNVTIDAINPLIDYTTGTPANNANLSQNYIFVNVTASDTNFANITYRLFNSTSQVNVTTYSTLVTNINFTSLPNGVYTYNVTVFDKASNTNTTATRTVTLDTIFPQFTNHQRNPSTPNEDQSVQINVTVTEANKDKVILEFNNGTNIVNRTVTTSNDDEFFFTINTGNYTAHDDVNYSWYANDTAGNLNKSSLQSFTVANQIPTVSAPALNDTTPETNDFISCDDGTFSDNDAEDSETARYFQWYDNDVLISGQGSLTLSLTVSGLNRGDVIKCGVRVSDSFDNSTFVNSSNTATIQNSPPVITNPLTAISWDANGSTFAYDYAYTDADGDSELWYDNTTLFDINGTGYISDTPTESEAGNYFIEINVSDGTVNATDIFTYTINDVTVPNIQFITFTETNGSQLTRDYIQVNISASDTNGIGTITLRLYNSTSLVQTNTSTSSPLFVNFTNLPDEFYFFNATVNDSSGNANQTETRTVSTDTGAPTINYVSPTENSGVIRPRNYIQINVTAGDPNLDKIVIRLYNSSNVQINSSITSTSPNFINFTGLNDGLYFYNATANDTFGNANSLETRNITLDTTKPSITDIVESPSDPATYSLGATYQFNATITDTNLDKVLIEFDSVNYTPTKTGNVYNLTVLSLAGGVHDYYWYVNDTAGNVNTSTQTYTVNQAAGNVNLLINNSAANQTGVYGTQTNASASTTEGTMTLLRNGTDVTSENNAFVALGVSYYNYTAVSSGNENFTSASATLFVTITQATSEVNLTLNGTDGNITIVQDSTIPLNLTTITGDSPATLKLYKAGTLINQGTSPLGNFTQFSSVGVFNITGFYETSQNFTGSFETWYVNVTETPDVTAPQFSNLIETPSDPATYSENQLYEFNITWTDNRNVSFVLIEFDGTNYSIGVASGDSENGVYRFTIGNLSAGTYNYYWYANDTSGNSNATSTQTYTVNQATPSLSLVISPSTTVTYGTETTATGSNCPSQITCALYRNNVAVSNPETATVAAGIHNYTYNTTGNENYTAYTNTTNLTVNKATGIVFTYLNNSRDNITIEQQTAIYLNGTLETGVGTITLYRNGTIINQGNSPLANFTNFTEIGSNNITTIYAGNANYTSAFETFFVDVIELDVTPPQISVLHPQNTSYNSIQTQLNYSASDNFDLDACWYSTNLGVTNTTITCGTNVSGLDSGEGSSTWTVYANDTKGNENSSSVTFFVDSVNPTINYVSPTETSGDTLSRNYIQVNVTASDANLDKIVIRLYNTTSLVQTNISSTSPLFVNFTGLSADTYFFNATANDTAGNSIDLATRNVSLVKPSITIIKPKNETYFNDKNLTLNFTASFENFVWYNLDNGANSTVSGNTSFNTSSGSHTLNLFANNTLGETVKNVTFFVNLTKFIIKYSNYSGNTSGSSTDFNQSSFEEIQNLSGVVLENTDFGKIQFNEAVNLTDDDNVADDESDLDSLTNISQNFIEINTTALPNLNKSARLYLYNLSFSNPRILRDGAVCSENICTKLSYSSGVLIFDVAQFTSYSAEEASVAASESPGGGAGGAAPKTTVECIDNSYCSEDKVCWNYQCVKLFDVKIIDFESPAKLGDFFDFTYSIKGQADINDDVVINFWIEKNGEKVTSGSDTIYLGSFEEKTETTKIFLPSAVESGIYDFYVEVSHGDYQARAQRTIEIEVKGGIASISPAEITGIKTGVAIALIILALIILSIIFYLERKNLEKTIVKETRFVKKYMASILAFLLFIVLGVLFYYLNVFDLIIRLFLNAGLWIKTNVLFIFYFFAGLILISFISAFIIFLIKSKFWKLKFRKEKKPIARKIKVHKINLPRLKLPHIKFPKIKFPRLRLPKIRLPKIKLPRLKLPHIRFPKLRFPRILLPKIKIPQTGPLEIKPVELPKIRYKQEAEIIDVNFEKTFGKFNRFIKKVFISTKKLFKKTKPHLKDFEKIIKEREKALAWELRRGKRGIKKTRRVFWVLRNIGKKIYHVLKEIPKFRIKGPQKQIYSLKTGLDEDLGKIKRKERKFVNSLKDILYKGVDYVENGINAVKIIGRKEKRFVRISEREMVEYVKEGVESMEEAYEKIFRLLTKIFGPKSRGEIAYEFEEKLVNTGKFTRHHLRTLRDVMESRKADFYRLDKNLYERLNETKREVRILIKDLVKYIEESDLIRIEKEKKRIEKETDSYLKAIKSVKNFLKKVPIVVKNVLMKSDEKVYDLFSTVKKDGDKIWKSIKKEPELLKEKGEGIKKDVLHEKRLIKTFFKEKLEGKEIKNKTAQQIVNDILMRKSKERVKEKIKEAGLNEPVFERVIEEVKSETESKDKMGDISKKYKNPEKSFNEKLEKDDENKSEI